MIPLTRAKNDAEVPEKVREGISNKVTIMTNLPLIVLELYNNIAKCTLTCVTMDQIDAIVFKLFYNLFFRRNKQS